MIGRKPPRFRPSRDDWPRLDIQGRVSGWISNDAGDRDGFVVDGATEIKFPPHRAREVGALVHVGDEVLCHGREHVLRDGSSHVHADEILLEDASLDLQSELTPDAALQRLSGFVPHRRDAGSAQVDAPSLQNILQRLSAIEAKLEELGSDRRESHTGV